MECKHPHSRLVKVTSTNGVHQFACQCIQCGNKATKWIPHDKVIYPEAVAEQSTKPPTMRDLMRGAFEAAQQLRAAIWEERQLFRLNCYKTVHWQTMRRIIFARCNGICEHCHIRKAEQGHHLTYDRLGCELPEDLLAVCRLCHEELHGIEREEFLRA